MTKKITPDDLVKKIKDVFVDTPFPGNDRQFHGVNIDDPDLEEVFRNLKWQDLSCDMLISHYMCMLYFTPQAFQYYLPAMLIETLENPERTEEDDIMDHLIYHITPDKNEPPTTVHNEDARQILSLLTNNQLEVLKEYMTYIFNNYQSLLSDLGLSMIENYWLPKTV
jgi:hypothetical protein